MSAPVFFNSYKLHSSVVGSRAIHNEMLQFSAKHNVEPLVEIIKFEGVETIKKIFKRLEENEIRSRAVLEM